MKKITTYLLGILVLGTLLQSCKKDDAAIVTYPSGQGEINATGGLTSSLTGVSTVFQRTVSGTTTTINIAGIISLSPQKGFGLSLQNITTVGTYSLAATTASQYATAVYYAGSASTDTYSSFYNTSSSPGTVTITSISAVSIEGTYTTTTSNTSGTAIAFSGKFKGNF